MTLANGFAPIGEILPGLIKEIVRRAELRLRLEAEWGRPLNDEEFLAIAKRDGEEL